MCICTCIAVLHGNISCSRHMYVRTPSLQKANICVQQRCEKDTHVRTHAHGIHSGAYATGAFPTVFAEKLCQAVYAPTPTRAVAMPRACECACIRMIVCLCECVCVCVSQSCGDAKACERVYVSMCGWVRVYMCTLACLLHQNASSTCNNASSTCNNASSTCNNASSTCNNASWTCNNASSTCNNASSTCNNASWTCNKRVLSKQVRQQT